jgi:PBP1b-binding outer membrane lipoprotein LpoB
MKTLTKSLLALVAVLSMAMFLTGCQSKSADYQGYSAPAAGSGVIADNYEVRGMESNEN